MSDVDRWFDEAEFIKEDVNECYTHSYSYTQHVHQQQQQRSFACILRINFDLYWKQKQIK